MSAKYAAKPIIGPNRRNYQCSAPGCDRKGYSGGLCNAHYIRRKRGADMAAPLKNRKRAANCIECGDLVSGKGGWHRCAKHYKSARRRTIKRAAIAIMGDQCSSCGDKHPDCVYDFHHVGSKKDAPSNLIGLSSADEIALELAQCVILCANCHRLEHRNDH